MQVKRHLIVYLECYKHVYVHESPMKPIYFILVGLFVALQSQLWFGEGNIQELTDLKATLTMQQARYAVAKTRNQRQLAQIRSLKTDHEEIEARARFEHNMVKQGETFYQIVER